MFCKFFSEFFVVRRKFCGNVQFETLCESDMMSRILFMSFVLIPQIFCGSLKTSPNVDSQINSWESQLRKDQQELKLKVSNILNETVTTRNLLTGNETFVISESLEKSLREIGETLEVSTTNLKDINSPDCAKVKNAISKIEANMLSYSNIIQFTNVSKVNITRCKEDVNTDYFENFMFLSDEQASSVLQLIANIEKFLIDVNVFIASFKQKSIQIANILYELKIQKQKQCKDLIEKEVQKYIMKMSKKSTTRNVQQNCDE